MTAKKTMKSETEREHDGLAAELVSLLPSLDAEGLAFLVQQARVHLYNMALDRDAAPENELSISPSVGKKKNRLLFVANFEAAYFQT